MTTRTHTTRRALTAVLGLGLAMTAAGCGGDRTIGKSEFARQDITKIATEAHAVRDEIRSMRVTGTLTEGATRLYVELQVADNETCLGTIEQGTGEVERSTSTIDLRQNREGTWVRPDRATLRATEGDDLSDEELKAAEGKWNPTTQGHALCDMNYWFDLFPIEADGTDGDGQALVKGDEVRLGGIRTVELFAGESQSEGARTAYVSSVAPHHVLKIEFSDAKSTANLNFNDFGDEFVVEAPPRETVRSTP